jgi:hypothetical protein
MGRKMDYTKAASFPYNFQFVIVQSSHNSTIYNIYAIYILIYIIYILDIGNVAEWTTKQTTEWGEINSNIISITSQKQAYYCKAIHTLYTKDIIFP